MQPDLLQDRFDVGDKTRNIALQLVCSNVAKQVARFLLPVFFLQDRFDVGDKTRNIALQLVLQQRCKTSCTFFVARFSVPLDRLGVATLR